MVLKKAVTKLNILIINQNIGARSELKTMLANLEQSEVSLMKDGRDLVGREQSFKYDLVFIREDLGYNLGGPDLVRYLTRTNLVPKWCKFVIITDNPSDCHAAPIFRHLRTEVMGSQMNYQMLKNVIDATIQSLKVFKELLKNLNHLPPGLLIKKVSAIDPSTFDDTHRDELLELKLKLLMQGRRPDLAWGISEKIQYDDDRFREQLFIAFRAGDKAKFEKTLMQAERCGVLQRGCIYYRTYHSLLLGETEIALRQFESLDEAELHPNEIEAHALLLLKAQGLRRATDYLQGKLQAKADNYDLRNVLTLCLLKCYCLALMRGDTDGQPRASVFNEINELIINNCWSKGSFRYNMYKPFILLCLAVLQGKTIGAHFEKLYRFRHQLDLIQLNILLFVAQKQSETEQAKEIHCLIDRNVARLEISPELIVHHVMLQDVLHSTMNSAQIIDRYRQLGAQQEKAGRLFRALKKYYFGTLATGPKDSDKVKMLELMKRLNIKQYWDMKPLQLLDEPAITDAESDSMAKAFSEVG